MTVEECQAWMRTAKLVDCASSHDKSGNKWESRIFETPQGLKRVYLCNGRPCHNHGKKGDYSPHSVRKVVNRIEQVQYETVI